MNTTLESLSNGVPMVAIPVANDQPVVAARIAYTGVGEVVSLKQLSVNKVRSPIGKVLTQEWYQKRPIALQDTIPRSGGVKKAADIIEQVVLTRKPVFPEQKPQTVLGFCALTEITAPRQTISKAVARIFKCLSIILKQSIFSHFREV